MTVSFLPSLSSRGGGSFSESSSSSSSPSSFYWVLCLPHLLFVIVSSPPRLLPSGKLGFNCVWGDVSFLRREALSRHTPRRRSSSPFLELIKVSLSSRRSLSSPPPPSSLFCESTVTVITTISNLFWISSLVLRHMALQIS